MEESHTLDYILFVFLCCFLELGQFKNHSRLSVCKDKPNIENGKKVNGKESQGFVGWCQWKVKLIMVLGGCDVVSTAFKKSALSFPCQ